MPNDLWGRAVGAGVLAMALVGLLALSGGGLMAWIDLPSALFVGVIVGLGLAAGFGPRRAVSAVLRLGDGDREVLRRGYQLSWTAGCLGTLIGLIDMLMHLHDSSALHVGVAVSLIALLYGGLLAEFGFRTLQAWQQPGDTTGLAAQP